MILAMELLIKYLILAALFRVGKSEISAEEVLDVVSARLGRMALELARISRRQNAIEARLDNIANDMKSFERSEAKKDTDERKDSLDDFGDDVVEDIKTMKKAIGSEKEYIRGQIADIEDTIAQMNDTLTNSMTERAIFQPSENNVPRGFTARIQTIEKTLTHQTTELRNLTSILLSMREDVSVSLILSVGLTSQVDAIERNVTALVKAVERKNSFCVRFEPPGNYALMLKSRRIPFNQIDFNDRSAYNATTGIFTAPESGVYQFIFFVEGWKISNDFTCETAVALLAVNGTAVAAAIAEPRHSRQTILAGNMYIGYVAKGQEAWIQTGVNCELYSIFGMRTSFMGVLLY